MANYYEILGVEQDAEEAAIKTAFRKIARECHPDVAGDDPQAAARFKMAREAYETLGDTAERTRYDLRRKRRAAMPKGGSFFDAFYRATGQAGARPSVKPRGSSSSAASSKGNDVTLEDLFDDFGDFGFGAGTGRGGPARPTARVNHGPQATTGEDVRVELDVPVDVAERGGAVVCRYRRLDRSDIWRPGASDPGLVMVDDELEVRIIPGTRDGDVLRERGRGSAGAHGGPYGDLVLWVRVAGARKQKATQGIVELSLDEALLGGRVDVPTPGGTVRLSIPPCTSGGVRFRLRGQGESGTDWFVVTRIVLPNDLDDTATALAERLAAQRTQSS